MVTSGVTAVEKSGKHQWNNSGIISEKSRVNSRRNSKCKSSVNSRDIRRGNISCNGSGKSKGNSRVKAVVLAGLKAVLTEV